MMKVRNFGIAVAALLLVASTVPDPSRADALGQCRSASNPEARLRACTEIIGSTSASAEQKALAYRNRGRTRAEAITGARRFSSKSARSRGSRSRRP